MSHPQNEEDYYSEDCSKATQLRKEDDRRLCIGQALLLLEHLDPHVFAIQASATGIVIYPRAQVQQLTTWERTLLQTQLPIPAEWIGGLGHIDQETQMLSRKSSHISEKRRLGFLRQAAASERARVVAFSLNQYNQTMQEFFCGGAISEIKSTPDACQSIYKARSGPRRWKRNGGHSSKTS